MSAVVADLQAGRFAEAAVTLRAEVERHPSDAGLWNLLGITQTELHHTKDAEYAFGRGLEIAPRSVSLNENAGLLYFREAQYARAKNFLEHAVQLGSDKPAVRLSLAGAQLRSGEERKALAGLQSLEPSLGDLSTYWEERGRAEMILDPAAANRSFDHAVSLSPRDIAALNDAATAAEAQHLDEKALAYLIQARAVAPDDVRTLMHFAAVCIRRDLGPDAVDALERVRRLAPSDQNAVYLLGRANISIQQWQAAHDLFKEFSRQQPSFAPCYYALGWLDIKLNRTAAARQELQHALLLDPHLNDARFELAQLELNDGRTDIAIHLLQAVLTAVPTHAQANMALGEIRMRQGNLPEARKLLERSVEQNPKLAAAHYKLSTVYTRINHPEQAQQEQKIAAVLGAEDKRASKTQLKLVLPEGSDETRPAMANPPGY